jgi:peptidoglycan/LPS O-acetylase OafA/YrhL
MADTPPHQSKTAPAITTPSAQTQHSPHDSHRHQRRGFWHKHSLSISSIVIVAVWIVAYCFADPSTHVGSFFGNAIADWSGVVVTVLATKWLYEKNSAESRRPPRDIGNPIICFLRDHSLSMFLLITGVGWLLLFARMDANGKWGQVVGNVVSEWTQIFGLVLLTKRLIERKSKESR